MCEVYQNFFVLSTPLLRDCHPSCTDGLDVVLDNPPKEGVMKRLVRAIANHLVNPDFTVGHHFKRSPDTLHGVDGLDFAEHLKLSFILGYFVFHTNI